MLEITIQHFFPLPHSLESIHHTCLNQSFLSTLEFKGAELILLVFLLDWDLEDSRLGRLQREVVSVLPRKNISEVGTGILDIFPQLLIEPNRCHLHDIEKRNVHLAGELYFKWLGFFKDASHDLILEW